MVVKPYGTAMYLLSVKRVSQWIPGEVPYCNPQDVPVLISLILDLVCFNAALHPCCILCKSSLQGAV